MLMGSSNFVTTESTAAPPLLLKLAFEVAVLGTSTLALFQRRELGRMSSKDWQCLDTIHHRYYKGDQEAVSITSPLLQGHTALFILLLRLVHVSRMDVSAMQHEHLTAIEYHLLNFERQHETAALVCPDSEPTLHSWTTMWRYVTIVLRIYLTSLQQPGLCSSSPKISALASKGLQAAREICRTQERVGISPAAQLLSSSPAQWTIHRRWRRYKSAFAMLKNACQFHITRSWRRY
jgi:hypothetical protein